MYFLFSQQNTKNWTVAQDFYKVQYMQIFKFLRQTKNPRTFYVLIQTSTNIYLFLIYVYIVYFFSTL